MAAGSQQRVTRISKRRVWVVAIVALLAVVVVLAGIKAAQIRKMIGSGKSFVIPPESVTSAKVEAVEWQSSRSAVGTLIAVRAVTLSSEVPGLVREIGFDSGMVVRRGDMLVKLDSSTEEGPLAAARAEADLARAGLPRARPLREAHASSPADPDAADRNAKQAAAHGVTLQEAIAKSTIR